MRRFIQPTDDASIYSRHPDRQTGLDEILEIGKTDDGRHIVRSLLNFNIAPLISTIPLDVPLGEVEFDLVLTNAFSTKLERDQTIEVHPVSGTFWTEGSGYFYQDIVPSSDGVTWRYSSQGELWDASGSIYSPTPVASASAGWPIADWSINVTELITEWVSGSVENYGLVLKFPDSDEVTDLLISSSLNQGNVKVFSRNSHTIHRPVLVAKWDDSFYTASLPEVDLDQAFITPRNLRPSYKRGELVRVNLTARNRYPAKSFQTMFSAFTGTYRLPENSYFSIVDMAANKVIIPFDEYSKVSTTESGSYIEFSTEAMYVLRSYKVLFKLVEDDREVVLDNRYFFRIDR